MRVTLNQDELFGAITEHLRDKLNLSDTASIEISFTAGRSPKGYTADVDITYPASELAQKCTAKPHEGDTTEASQDDSKVSVATNVPDATAGGAVSPNLFDI
jgi:hypothetical protein